MIMAKKIMKVIKWNNNNERNENENEIMNRKW